MPQKEPAKAMNPKPVEVQRSKIPRSYAYPKASIRRLNPKITHVIPDYFFQKDSNVTVSSGLFC
jgi:hypothetical protein